MVETSEIRQRSLDIYNGRVIVFTLLLYCISGTLLTLINKLVVVVFPYVNTLLILQNGVTVVLLLSISRLFPNTFGTIPSFNTEIFRLWLPITFCFVMILISSLKALLYVSIPTVVVIRNLSTLLVAFLEYIFLSRKIDIYSIVTLLGMLFGAILYANHDLTLNVKGYAWLCANVIATSSYQVYIKKIIDIPTMAGIGALGMSYFNNLLSLPVLLILAYSMKELTTLVRLFQLKLNLNIESLGIILISCILGFLLSTTAFVLNKLISPTSIMVANNVNKFFVIILSEVLIQQTLDSLATLGAIAVLFFGWLYSQIEKSFSKPVLALAVVVFALLGCALKFSDDKFRPILLGNNISHTNIYQSYLPIHKSSKKLHQISPGIVIKNTTEFRLPESCRNRQASVWKTCNPVSCNPYNGTQNWIYPRTTNTGERTGEFINRVLKAAWGASPSSIDLYVRVGCNGIMEIKYLFESIEIFWPRFLGSIIVVLDIGDQAILNKLLPEKPTHHYIIAFESVPCLPGRVFNQYSYLNLDRHSTADYIVTIDSDCVFHLPVTPDLIFRQNKLLLLSSRTFQKDMWYECINAMLGKGLYDGHYMVTQPVTFALSTFSEFRKWFYKSQGICYEDRITELSPRYYGSFCWMCQLGTYLERGSPPKFDHDQYWFHHLDNITLEPILRYAIHVTYEPYEGGGCSDPQCYDKSANKIIMQGLCRAFGSFIFHFCTNFSDFTYVNKVTFLYANTEIQAANAKQREKALRDYLNRLSHVIAIALRSNTH